MSQTTTVYSTLLFNKAPDGEVFIVKQFLGSEKCLPEEIFDKQKQTKATLKLDAKFQKG